MKKLRKKLKRPKIPYDSVRIKEEKKLLKDYGLRRKREIWRAEEILRNFRRRARNLIATQDEEREKALLEKLSTLGLLEEEASLDNVLALEINDILDRRLQTLVYKKGLAQTPNQARQFITHGHIQVDGDKVTYPAYLVPKEKEKKIECKMEAP